MFYGVGYAYYVTRKIKKIDLDLHVSTLIPFVLRNTSMIHSISESGVMYVKIFAVRRFLLFYPVTLSLSVGVRRTAVSHVSLMRFSYTYRRQDGILAYVGAVPYINGIYYYWVLPLSFLIGASTLISIGASISKG